MRKLIDFLWKNKHWFLFLTLELISFVLIYQNNAYQQRAIFSSANLIAGHLSSVSSSTSEYFYLRGENERLLDKNKELERQVLQLKEELNTYTADSLLKQVSKLTQTLETDIAYEFAIAKVVNNSTTHLSNYITINKGEKDGIKPDMGVLSESGVAGIVSTVSSHFAVIIPILNPKFQLSCKIKGSEFLGTLKWNGRNARYANLIQLPRHTIFEVGDSVVTSGYSAVFPEGLLIGTVESFDNDEQQNNFYTLKVKLATQFETLHNVCVVTNKDQTEQRTLEQEARKND